MAVRMWPADVGRTWFCETVHKIDAGALAVGCSRLRREREYQSLCFFQGSAGGMRAGVWRRSWEAGVRVIYERCAAVDVGKDVIAVAVRLPGDGPDGERRGPVLADLAKGRMRAKIPDLAMALEGRFGDHHALMCRLHLDHIDHLEAMLARLD
jgi:hypothetical protein